MKNNRIMWGLVALVVSITIAVSLGTMSSHSQQDNSKKQDNNGYEDLSKYAIVDYNVPEPGDAVEREERRLKNKRYDNQDWVMENPHPDDGGVGLINDMPSLPMIPVAESNLIVIGEVVGANAHLSNDKSSVYTEFAIRINETLKNDVSNKMNQGDYITVDRAGGYIRYPNGQKVLYKLSQNDLPRVGSQYVLFLITDKKSPNYEILIGYELKDNNFIPLDKRVRLDDFKGSNKQDFIKAIRNKIAESSQPIEKSRRKL